jgi:hypothetical protein
LIFTTAAGKIPVRRGFVFSTRFLKRCKDVVFCQDGVSAEKYEKFFRFFAKKVLFRPPVWFFAG